MLLFLIITQHNQYTLLLPLSLFLILNMQLTSAILSAFFLGAAVLPTALAAKSPCKNGNSVNQGEACGLAGWYSCSNNLKHTVSFALLLSQSSRSLGRTLGLLYR
jgi:hypothetical protein